MSSDAGAITAALTIVALFAAGPKRVALVAARAAWAVVSFAAGCLISFIVVPPFLAVYLPYLMIRLALHVLWNGFRVFSWDYQMGRRW